MATNTTELGDNAFSADFSNFVRVMMYAAALLLLSLVLFVVLGYFKIASYAFATYDSYVHVPHHRVGLLLGTSSNVQPGQPNEFFTNRIMAAASLFHKGKIDYILVSGDNRHRTYNEPLQMTNALKARGVPEERIIADNAGYTTLDSVIRAKRVFLLDDVLIISQAFHNERAIFIADHSNLKAAGFNASDPSSTVANCKVGLREFFARIKGVFDVYIFNSQPEELGGPIPIGGASLPKEPSGKPKASTSKAKHAGLSLSGMRDAALQEVRAYAKQPSDSAFYIRQVRRAQEIMRQRTAESEQEDGDGEEDAGWQP